METPPLIRNAALLTSMKGERQMFLSFIIPVYNAETYLKECLESILQQDLSHDEYEIICVNDGSTDRSLDFLKEYEKIYDNIRVINQENSGVSAARNIGLDTAEGEYVWFVDADDFIGRNVLNMLQTFLSGGLIDVAQLGAYPFQDELLQSERPAYESGKLQPKSYANNVFVTRNIFKKAFLNEHQIRFYTELSYSEDKVLISEVLSKNPVVKQVKKACYYYRYHIGSAITKERSLAVDKLISMRMFAIARFQETYEVAPISYKSAIADNLMSEVYQCFYTIAGVPSGQFKAVKHQLKLEGYFLIRRPKECTLRQSYLVDHSKIFGKIFDFVYIRLNSNIGFTLMRCIRLSVRALKKVFIR